MKHTLRIAQARKEAGLTQQELAEKMGGIHVKNVCNWEQGRTTPPLNTLMQLCDVLGCDADYLLGRIDCHTHDAQFIQEKTGLSEKAIESLSELAGLVNEVDATIEKGMMEWPKVSLAQKSCAILYLVDRMLSGETNILASLAGGCVDVMECMMSAAVAASQDPEEMSFYSITQDCRKTVSATNYAASVYLATFLNKAMLDPVFLLELRKYSITLYSLTDGEAKAQWERLGIPLEKVVKVEKPSKFKASRASKKMQPSCK